MRIASIDILRALTMLLMIWVNDFWTLTEVPKWLEHASSTEDYLGFSDIIFPLFLFIVGLSIPYAIDYRLKMKDTPLRITKHILVRTLSLLFIGVFMVNYETAHESIIIGKNYWGILMALAVFLIWMHWEKSTIPNKWHIYLKVLGVIIFAYLMMIYKGGPNGENWMTTQWWGILGLIGWAYIINALVYLLSKKGMRLPIMIGLLVLFNILAVLSQKNLIQFESNSIFNIFSVIISGTIPAFTTAGIVATLLFKKLADKNLNWCYVSLIIFGVTNIIYGLATRSIWGISKIQGTPSWLAICVGIGFLSFVILHYITDVKKKTNWAKIIAPAGTATLTCYLIPYLVYPIRDITGFRFPDFLNTSIIGLLISFAYALLVVLVAGWFEKKHYKLKL